MIKSTNWHTLLISPPAIVSSFHKQHIAEDCVLWYVGCCLRVCFIIHRSFCRGWTSANNKLLIYGYFREIFPTSLLPSLLFIFLYFQYRMFSSLLFSSGKDSTTIPNAFRKCYSHVSSEVLMFYTVEFCKIWISDIHRICLTLFSYLCAALFHMLENLKLYLISSLHWRSS